MKYERETKIVKLKKSPRTIQNTYICDPELCKGCVFGFKILEYRHPRCGTCENGKLKRERNKNE